MGLGSLIGLLQRVDKAQVTVTGQVVGAIDVGLMVLVGVERGDSEATVQRLLERLLGYRVFADSEGRMNRSLHDVGGGLLLVPQFTLPADTRKGMRPSFSPAAVPEVGERLFNTLVNLARQTYSPVAAGCFGAEMKVALVNDGPVTFWLRVAPPDGAGG